MPASVTPRLIVHGGAGVPPPGSLDPDFAARARSGLTRALETGASALAAGQSAVDAVEGAVRVMEDDECFNAGVGGALTSDGHVEHDAAIMSGRDRRAGAITGTRRVRNPVSLARRILDDGRQVLLSAAGAEAFARAHGIALEPPEIFVTERRRAALARVRAGGPKHAPLNEQDRHGTVGAVALDAAGHLAAATSTGGRTNKHPGRVGDSPIIGAGTYADDATVAVSCTGHGEYFMRAVTAHRVAALVELAGLDAPAAAGRALDELAALGGTGGLIVLDGAGRMALRFNTSGMYRGSLVVGGAPLVAIHRD